MKRGQFNHTFADQTAARLRNQVGLAYGGAKPKSSVTSTGEGINGLSREEALKINGAVSDPTGYVFKWEDRCHPPKVLFRPFTVIHRGK